MKSSDHSLAKSLICSVVLCGVSAFLGGCGGGGDSSDGSSGGGSACNSIGYAAALKVANGEQCVADSESDTSSVVKLRIETRDGSIGTCTGTVISTTAVLTAGHCFAYSDWSRVIITAVSAGRKVDVQSTSVVVHPNFRASLSEGLFFNDAAIVKVGSALPVPPLPLLVSRAPQVGEDSTVAGYGQTENGGAAVDDVVAGQAVIRSVTDNHLRIDYRDGESHPCKGDSGGALLVQQGEGLAIAGVVSQSDPSVTADQICEQGEDKTLYTNTQQASVSNFILAQARGAATK